jgi:hypothetical protein
MSIRWLDGYWTIYSGEQPIVACPSFARALELVLGS